MKGAVNRINREQRARAWQAWATAALMRSKRLPRFEKLLNDKPSENKNRKPRQPWQVQLAYARIVHASLLKKGGARLRTGKE